MYWIANKAGWYRNEAPIETEAFLIEAFAECAMTPSQWVQRKCSYWKNKQTKNWPTTKATTEAVTFCWCKEQIGRAWKTIQLSKLVSEKILTKKLIRKRKRSRKTSYVKLNWKTNEITKEMATISIENKSKVPGFGGVYWQSIWRFGQN